MHLIRSNILQFSSFYNKKKQNYIYVNIWSRHLSHLQLPEYFSASYWYFLDISLKTVSSNWVLIVSLRARSIPFLIKLQTSSNNFKL